MHKLNKIVNIYPSGPIVTVNPPIRSTVKRVTKSVKEIRACLMARAMVEEVLADGSTVRLNMSNYDTFNDKCSKKCGCGVCTCNSEKADEPVSNENNKSVWQAAYDNAIGDRNLAILPRKQRRSIEAAARAAADAAVAEAEPEVVMGVAAVETVEEPKVEEVVEEVESVEVVEEEVATVDIEALPVNE